MEDQVKGIFDIGYLYPNEDKIVRFLDKLHSISYSNSITWERLIFDFFKDNPFVIYAIERTMDKESLELYETCKEIITSASKGVIFLDTNMIYKELCTLKESININKNIIKKAIEYLFRLSIILRKATAKTLDDQDSSFKQFSSALVPHSYECKTDDKEQQVFYENIYFLCADNSLKYNLEADLEPIRKAFASKLNSIKVKESSTKTKKRNPLDSRLRHECFKRDNYTCKECGANKSQKMLHCDHIIPVSQGGTDELSNLQTLCDDCNFAKYNRCFKAGEINGTAN